MSLSIRDQSQVQGFSAWSELNYFVYRKLSSWDAFFKWYHNRAKWNIFTVLAPAANTTNIDYEQSLTFYCSQSTANNDQFRVNTQDLLSYNLIKHRDGHKEQNTGQPETRIMKVMYKSIPKPPIPPGQSPGIWLALSSVQWGIWPKMRPARWGIWLSCQNVCQRSETKGFRNSLIVDTTRVFLLLSFLYRKMH